MREDNSKSHVYLPLIPMNAGTSYPSYFGTMFLITPRRFQRSNIGLQQHKRSSITGSHPDAETLHCKSFSMLPGVCAAWQLHLIRLKAFPTTFKLKISRHRGIKLIIPPT